VVHVLLDDVRHVLPVPLGEVTGRVHLGVGVVVLGPAGRQVERQERAEDADIGAHIQRGPVHGV
jgi:hypothetical protein